MISIHGYNETFPILSANIDTVDLNIVIFGGTASRWVWYHFTCSVDTIYSQIEKLINQIYQNITSKFS